MVKWGAIAAASATALMLAGCGPGSLDDFDYRPTDGQDFLQELTQKGPSRGETYLEEGELDGKTYLTTYRQRGFPKSVIYETDTLSDNPAMADAQTNLATCFAKFMTTDIPTSRSPVPSEPYFYYTARDHGELAAPPAGFYDVSDGMLTNVVSEVFGIYEIEIMRTGGWASGTKLVADGFGVQEIDMKTVTDTGRYIVGNDTLAASFAGSCENYGVDWDQFKPGAVQRASNYPEAKVPGPGGS